VSTTLVAAMPVPKARAAVIVASIRAGVTNGRAPSWTANNFRCGIALLQAIPHGVLAFDAAVRDRDHFVEAKTRE